MNTVVLRLVIGALAQCQSFSQNISTTTVVARSFGSSEFLNRRNDEAVGVFHKMSTESSSAQTSSLAETEQKEAMGDL